jgi:quinol monooxygenase YgiN
MIGAIATIKIQDGKAEEFEQIFRDLTAKVKANEPGALFYQLTKSRTEANTYKVLEMYADQTAMNQHGRTDHFKALGPAMGACLDGRPHIDLLDVIE